MTYSVDPKTTRNLRRNNGKGWPLRSHEILELFELPPTSPIPKNHIAFRTIGNVGVYILPCGLIDGLKRRVVAECPKCFKPVCAGHLHQHIKIHVGD